MKTTLVSVLLLTATVCSAQPARTRETTNGSWNHPNLSIETWDARNWIIAGTTEPNFGVLCPTFKFTNPNLIPVVMAPLPTYRIQHSTSKVLMDFTLDQNTGRLIMTGTDPLSSTTAMNMYITVINSPNGGIVNNIQVPLPGFSLIPHQVIYSAANNHIVVVGTKVAIGLTNTNFSTIPKTGFVLIVNATTMAIVNFIETDTPSVAGGPDSDMLESVTEVPGNGYFAGGSANGFNNPVEQNMMVMRVVAGTWTPGPSLVLDNTTGRSVVSSVMYNPALGGRVIVMNNNSDFGTYELISFNPIPASPVFPAVRYTLNTCMPAGTVTNGFRLQQNTAGSQVIVAGYAQIPGSITLTPFQTTTTPNLIPFVNAKIFQSANSSPLAGYFNEAGNPPYVNTPDIVTYHASSNRTFLVNPNTNFGFDMLRSVAGSTLACEAGCSFTTATAGWPVGNNVTFTQSIPLTSSITTTFVARSIADAVLCSSTPLAPMEDETTMEATESGIVLFPNPAKDVLEIAADIAITEIVVYDLNGSKVLEAVNEANESGIRMIDINPLKPGAYLITLKDQNGNLERMKFVKE